MQLKEREHARAYYLRQAADEAVSEALGYKPHGSIETFHRFVLDAGRFIKEALSKGDVHQARYLAIAAASVLLRFAASIGKEESNGA